MIDAVLYRRDRRGRLRLLERIFMTLDGLALFFASDETGLWEWAEVTAMEGCGPLRGGLTVRYTARELRELIAVGPSGHGPASG